MDSLSDEMRSLIRETRFPPPDDPSDPRSKFTLTIEQVRQIGATIGALVDYIEVEYARCGKTETP